MQEEVWRDIIGFDEYKISNFGNVVAEIFLENPNRLPYIRHKNGNRRDNRAVNLEYYG